MAQEQEQEQEDQQQFRKVRIPGERVWTNSLYTLKQIMAKARKDNRYVVDGYGRARVRQARKLQVVDRLHRRPTIEFDAVVKEEKAPSPFGPRTSSG